MGKSLATTDMPALTRNMQREIDGIETALQRALLLHCSGHTLFDSEGAYEKLRTFAVEFYDCYYTFYSQYPAYKALWQKASETFAFQRICIWIDNYSALRGYFLKDQSRLKRIRNTIMDYASGVAREKSGSGKSRKRSNITSISLQLAELIEESRLTREQVAEQIGIDKRNVFRHLRGTIPRPSQIAAYETVFTKALGKPIKIRTS